MWSFLLTLAVAHADGNANHDSYQGSSFSEVEKVIHDVGFSPKTQIEKKEFEVYQKRHLPLYPTTVASIFGGQGTSLEKDAQRTTNERFDYYDRLPKKLHPNGICVTGVWKITEPNKYTGFFQQGSEGLFVGRVSVTMDHTRQGQHRGFGVAGKIFPTMNPLEVTKTANFFTVDVLLGTNLDHVMKARTTNQPETGFDVSLIGLGFKILEALKTADHDPGFRPLTPIAKMNTTGDSVTPKWMRLSAKKVAHISDAEDFRTEVLETIRNNGHYDYNIEVSDETHDRFSQDGWKSIGTIHVDHGVVSYGCDRRLHFAHPKLNN